MTRLSVDYEGLVQDLTVPLVSAEVGNALLGAVAERYERVRPDCSLMRCTQSRATYRFDLASAVGAAQLASCGLTSYAVTGPFATCGPVSLVRAELAKVGGRRSWMTGPALAATKDAWSGQKSSLPTCRQK